MMRTIKEWIGKTDDTPVPPRVRLRVYLRDGGICQCGCTRIIRAGDQWETDHTVALVNGGENREQNLRTLLHDCHTRKTGRDTADKAHAYKKRKKHYGLKTKKTGFRQWRRFDGTIVKRLRT